MRKLFVFSLVFMMMFTYLLSNAYAAPLSEDSGELESGGLSGEVSLPGVVKYPDGTSCTSASQCLSQNCVDGYCCNSPCSGLCDSCSVTSYEGLCTDTNSLCSGTSNSCYCSSGSCITCNSGYSCSSYVCVLATTASASGGGGGGGGATTIPQPTGESETQVWSEVTSGSTISMNIENSEIAIIKITIEIGDVAKNVQIQVIALTEAPQTAILMKTEVYQYLKIDKVNIENTGIIAATIKFRVPKPWLSEKNLSYDQIALYKYVNNNWEELDTTVLNSDNAYVYYEAKTSGFSYFAVGVKEIRKEAPYVEEEKKTEEIVAQEEVVAPEEKKAPEITGAAVTVPEGAITPLAVAWTLIILAIIAAVFIFIKIRRKPPTPSFKELKKRSKEIDNKIEKIDRELKNTDKK